MEDLHKNLLEAIKQGDVTTLNSLLADPIATSISKQFYLFAASEEGQLEAVKSLLAHGALVSPYDGAPPLLVATHFGHVEVARTLVEWGASLDMVDFCGSSALSTAARVGSVELVKILLAAGAPVDGVKGEAPPLIVATREGNVAVIEELLENEANIEAKFAGDTALITACKLKSLEIVALLLSYDPYVDQLCKARNPGIVYAAARGASDIVELLLQRGAKVGLHEAALRACKGAHLSTARLLLGLVDIKYRYSALIEASEAGHKPTVDLLLDFNTPVDLFYENFFPTTPLGSAAQKGHLEVVNMLAARGARAGGWSISSVDMSNAELVARMLELGAKMDKTSLDIVANFGRIDVLHELLQRWQGPVPLSAVSTACGNGHIEVVKAMIRHGAHLDPVDIVDSYGKWPLLSSCTFKHYDVAALLLDHGAKPISPACMSALYVLCEDNSPAAHDLAILMLQQDPTCANMRNSGIHRRGKGSFFKERKSPLQMSIDCGNLGMVWILTLSGAHIEPTRTVLSETPTELEKDLVRALKHLWSPREHKYFPKQIRDSIYCFLMVAKRLFPFDTAIQRHIISFLPDMWFVWLSATRKRSSGVDKATQTNSSKRTKMTAE